MAPKKVLIVDDDEGFVASNRDMLEVLGYEVGTASNGAEALEQAMALKPDLMILDVMMTYDTEGFDVARKMRSIPELAGMKILLVSGIVSAKNLPKAAQPDEQWLPVERVLEKPIDPPKLIGEIEKLIGN
ncbi:MAG: response regulator [Chitinivibrionales bacterium]|nr:response regulator [Chitinivibrionales bacterium]